MERKNVWTVSDAAKKEMIFKFCEENVLFNNMMFWSKHANLMYECITYYIYAYQLRCTKQDVLRTLI